PSVCPNNSPVLTLANKQTDGHSQTVAPDTSEDPVVVSHCVEASEPSKFFDVSAATAGCHVNYRLARQVSVDRRRRGQHHFSSVSRQQPFFLTTKTGHYPSSQQHRMTITIKVSSRKIFVCI